MGDQGNDKSLERLYALDYMALRVLVGFIMLLLVVVVYLFNWLLFTGHAVSCLKPGQPGSLSQFYYTPMRNVFAGGMLVIGVFFLVDRGASAVASHNFWLKLDFWTTNVVGVASILIALCPTSPPTITGSDRCGIIKSLPAHNESLRVMQNALAA